MPPKKTRDAYQRVRTIILHDLEHYPATEYRFQVSNFKCRLYRALGNWCGAVQVPASHPFFKKSPREIERLVKQHGIKLHGGVPQVDLPTNTISFSTAHFEDIDAMPFIVDHLFPNTKKHADILEFNYDMAILQLDSSIVRQYWTFDMVKSHLILFVQQLIAIMATS